MTDTFRTAAFESKLTASYKLIIKLSSPIPRDSSKRNEMYVHKKKKVYRSFIYKSQKPVNKSNIHQQANE